jgi:hypothetical protein
MELICWQVSVFWQLDKNRGLIKFVVFVFIRCKTVGSGKRFRGMIIFLDWGGMAWHLFGNFFGWLKRWHWRGCMAC